MSQSAQERTVTLRLSGVGMGNVYLDAGQGRELARIAREFDAEIEAEVLEGGRQVGERWPDGTIDVKSGSEMAGVKLSQEAKLRLFANGPDAEEALGRLEMELSSRTIPPRPTAKPLDAEDGVDVVERVVRLGPGGKPGDQDYYRGGLWKRPAAVLARIAREFEAEIRLWCGEDGPEEAEVRDPQAPYGARALCGTEPGEPLHLQARGPDAEQALQELGDALENRERLWDE